VGFRCALRQADAAGALKARPALIIQEETVGGEMDHRLPAGFLFERRLRGQSPLELVDLPPTLFLLPESAHFLRFRERSGERGKLQRLEIIARRLRTAQQRREQGRGGAASRGGGP